MWPLPPLSPYGNSSHTQWCNMRTPASGTSASASFWQKSPTFNVANDALDYIWVEGGEIGSGRGRHFLCAGGIGTGCICVHTVSGQFMCGRNSNLIFETFPSPPLFPPHSQIITGRFMAATAINSLWCPFMHLVVQYAYSSLWNICDRLLPLATFWKKLHASDGADDTFGRSPRPARAWHPPPASYLASSSDRSPSTSVSASPTLALAS